MDRRIKNAAFLLAAAILIVQQDTVLYADEVSGRRQAVIAGGSGETGSGETGSGETGNGETGGETDGGETGGSEPEKPIEKYTVDIPRPDGKNGYYVTKPKVVIHHTGERGSTRYELLNSKTSETEKTEGTLDVEKPEGIIEAEAFTEGTNKLIIWMEDEEGKKVENMDSEQEFHVDTRPPEIHMEVPGGYDVWHKKQVILSAVGEDAVSKVAQLTCYAAGKKVGTAAGDSGRFTINRASSHGNAVEVSVIAEDEAGNQSERVKGVYIDSEAPKTRISGAEEYMITSQPLTVTYEIEEDNVLQEFVAQTEWENVQGQQAVLPVAEWTDTGNGKCAVQNLTEDGRYRMQLGASDKAGYQSSRKMQVIIDKGNPVIRHVDELQGSYLKEFAWNYLQEELIQDFTTYTYEIRLDGRLYPMGETVTTEGRHHLEVTAKDAAGNEAAAGADFVIDHTKPQIVFSEVEDGKEYEEKRTFQVSLANPEDSIEQIQINGEAQKVNARRKTYEYTVDECKDYEVKVRAKDRAGNDVVKSILFKVIPKETVIQKITKPFRNTFSTGKGKTVENLVHNKGDAGVKMWKKIIPVMIPGIVAVTAAGYWYLRKTKQKKKHKKTP